jgi:hypothetical protein
VKAGEEAAEKLNAEGCSGRALASGSDDLKEITNENESAPYFHTCCGGGHGRLRAELEY